MPKSDPMHAFLEFHLLTSHAPSNLNRDELGTPKTAIFGGERRLRISSQCLKRTWRVSPLFAEEMTGQHAVRTKYIPEQVYRYLLEQKVAADRAATTARQIIDLTHKEDAGAGEEDDAEEDGPKATATEETHQALVTPQLILIAQKELDALKEYCLSAARAKKAPTGKEFSAGVQKALGGVPRDSVDLALFGRMVTSDAIFDVDSALQVADAISTHRIELEFDYFTAVDDLETESKGAGHIGEAEFAAAVFYKYAVCALGALRENLGGDGTLAARAVATLLRAMCLTSPSGKQNAHAAHNPADYVLVRLRHGQPMSLANAFAKAVSASGKESQIQASVAALESYLGKLAKAYGDDESEQSWILCVSPDTTLSQCQVENLKALAAAVEAAVARELKE